MINYAETHASLEDILSAAGYKLELHDGVVVALDLNASQSLEIDAAVQAIIDIYDPLPAAQAEAKELVKQASATQRLKFVTQAAGKDAEYTYKALEATRFDADGSIGVFMQGRINATNETAVAVAAEWNAKGAGWKLVGAAIAGLEDKANILINAETDWKNCVTIANSIIAQIEAI